MTEASERKYKTGKIREQNTQVIIDAAEQEFSAHGFRGTSMQAISDRAGLPKANLHYYYKNKENLYAAVLENIIDTWNTGLSDVGPEDDPAEVLEGFIRSKLDLSFTRPQGSKLFATEILAGAPYLNDYIRSDMRRFVRDLAKVFKAWVDSGQMRPVDPMQLIFLIWSSTQHYADFDSQVLTLMNRAEFADEDIEIITRNLVSIILTGCGLKPSWER